MTEAAAQSSLEIGSVIADTYEIVRLLGRGGMGAVWEAHHRRLPGKRVAIKVLHADVASEGETLARFRREAEIATRLGHANIVEVHDFNSLPGGAPYLVLEYLEGESLDARLSRGPMSLPEVTRLVRQVGSALRAAHNQNIFHRDLKPQNVFLVTEADHSEELWTAKVLDFGISKIRGSQTVKTHDSTMLGTPQYMAPEQATGNHEAVNPTTDIFAFGAMVYEMFAGRPAFQGSTIPEVVFKVVYEQPEPLDKLCPELPETVVEAVHKALSKEQEDRFPQVEEFVVALTGSRLTTTRSAQTPAQTGAGRSNPAAATAETVGVATADTIDSGAREALLAGDDTIASQSAPVPAGPAATSAETPSSRRGVVSPVPAEAERPPTVSGTIAKRSAGIAAIVMGAAVVGAIAAVVAVLVVMRPDSQSTLPTNGAGDLVAEGPGDSSGEPVAAADAGTTPDAGAAPDAGDANLVATADAGAQNSDTAGVTNGKTQKDNGKDAATKQDAGKKHAAQNQNDSGKRNGKSEQNGAKTQEDASKQAQQQSAEAEVVAVEPASGEAKRALERANQALKSGDVRNAIHHGKRAIRNGARAEGRFVLAKAYCVRHDLGNVNAYRHGLPGGMTKRLRRFCEGVGFPLPE